MQPGTLYGIGVGPGDPEWITVKAVNLLARCRQVCVPRARPADDSVALQIARRYLCPDAAVHEITFPMSSDAAVLRHSWRAAAEQVAAILRGGDDCCFLTLGDPLLYSTYIYLLRELRQVLPDAAVVTVPGVTAFSAAAAATNFPIGTGKQPVTIVPACDDLDPLRRALDVGGTVILMKVGKRLQAVLAELKSRGLLGRAVFASHLGMPRQRVETDLSRLIGQPEEIGYLSIVIIQATVAEGEP